MSVARGPVLRGLFAAALVLALGLGPAAWAQARGWAVVVGIDRYASPDISRLKGAVNDAKALASTLTQSLGMPRNQVLLYTSESDQAHRPTTANVVKALRYVGQRARPGDPFVLAFSGHGISRGEDSYLLTYHSDLGAAEYTALKVRALAELVRAIPSRKKLVVLDACRNDPRAGKGDHDNVLTASFSRGVEGARPLKSGQAGQGGDRVVATLFSCGLGERSYEWGAKGRGFFSWHLEQGLRGKAADDQGRVTLAGLVTYLRREVPQSLAQVSGVGPRQTPFAKMEGNDPGAWVLNMMGGQDWQKERQRRAAEKERLAALLARQDRARAQQAAQERQHQEAIAKLDQEIAAMQKRLGAGQGQQGDSLDALVALAKQKKAQKEKLAALERQRQAEEARRQAEIERLKREAFAKNKAALEADIGKYQEVIKAVGKDSPLTGQAWQLLLKRYGLQGKVKQGEINQFRRLAEYKLQGLELFITSIGMEFVRIPAGSFMMGSPPDERGRQADEGPQHRVTISKPFYMQTTEVTQGQWQTVMGSNPSKFKQCGANCPVENVSWNDAWEFIRRLNQREGANKYRLPSGAEWEYACRAGTSTPFYFGETISTDQANYDGNLVYPQGRKGVYREKTVPVKGFPPNAWGLYDMHGNVWEWVNDWYGEKYYASSPAIDPQGPSSGTKRVLRGGSWRYPPWQLRSADSGWGDPAERDTYVGFRVARDVD